MKLRMLFVKRSLHSLKIILFRSDNFSNQLSHSQTVAEGTQSSQAIRILYGEQDDELSTTKYLVRPIYGPFAVLKSTGTNPQNIFVRPFTK